jgi:hypothetical protein
LWVSRRLSRASARRAGRAGRQGSSRFGWPWGQLHRPAARGARLAIVVLALALALALTAAAAAALRFAGTSSVANSSLPDSLHPGRAGHGAARSGASSHVAAVIRSEAAAWVAGEVGSDQAIACDPAMCAALRGRGVAPGRLLPLGPGAAVPRGAGVIVASPQVRAQLGGQLAGRYAPGLIASFGAGGDRIEVRAADPGGAAGYQSALRADLAARQSAGSELLRNRRIRFSPPDAARLRAGEVDSRLLATLAALSSQFSFRVSGFGDAAPGVQVLFREVTVTGTGGRDGAAGLAAVLALVRAQHRPYLPADATIVRPTIGPAALHIQFAAPSPLGLLTAVLLADTQRAPR